ncbi:hypothetical protein UCRPC4_g05449 [Phaeomoniella chlamydospora]|uniref:CENP-T/Histone H4 histone fold domain-containing protein n=1 Tax=Phaeomoniella chlamydospora TaxID=158046 RepID=A0A0G2GL57_PHACM|nr:hypothetical protein UCRPC4_g05449 [Phaeomoniella chlamydospora]
MTLSSPDDEDSNIGPAPRVSILPGEDEGSMYQGHRKPEGQEDDFADDEDVEGDGHENFTLKSIEYGRRAMNRRLSRPSFGSIMMSDFRGMVGDQDGDSGIGKGVVGIEESFLGGDDQGVIGIEGDDTEDSRMLRLRRSMSMPGDDTVNSLNIDAHDEDTFRLHFNAAAERRKSLASQQPPLALASDKSTSPMFFTDERMADSHGPAPAPASPTQASGWESEPETEPSSPEPAVSHQNQALPAKVHRKKQKISKHGIKVPTLPSSLIKRLGMDALVSMGRRKSRIGRDSLKALEQATEWFFEQIGEDLEVYAEHAGRQRRIVENDVVALMKRQRRVSSRDARHSLAKEHLPKDVLRELDLP